MVGAYAVIYYTEPRYTKDLDIWIEPTIENAKRVYNALKEFGAPLKDITFEDFTNKNLFYQIGVAPVRVDIIMGISDLEFSKAWKSRKRANFEGIKVNIIGIDDLIKLKEKTKRDIDKMDVNILKLKLKLRREK
jgi:predicted nucleotidyltransferase